MAALCTVTISARDFASAMEAVAGTAWASVASVQSTQLLCGLLHPLLGMLVELLGSLQALGRLPGRYVGYCSICVGFYSICMGCTCVFWDTLSSMWGDAVSVRDVCPLRGPCIFHAGYESYAWTIAASACAVAVTMWAATVFMRSARPLCR